MSAFTWYNSPNGIRKTGARLEPAPGVSHRECAPMTVYDSTTLARFWAKVDKSGDCWLWTAARMPHGYGVFRASSAKPRRHIYAHRFSYQVTHGPIPQGLWVRHKCDTPACVNPAHLELGTPADNTHDSMRRGRMPLGEARPAHKLTAANVEEVRRRIAAGESSRMIAAAFNVSDSTIGDIRTGRTWKGGRK